MKLKEKLDLMRLKTTDDIDYEDFSKIIENKFLTQTPSNIENGSRVKLSYIERRLDFKDEKVLYVAYLKSENSFSMIGVPDIFYEESKFMKEISWEVLKKWCKRFCLEQGFEELKILETSHLISIIYTAE